VQGKVETLGLLETATHLLIEKWKQNESGIVRPPSGLRV
jgi:hypothetical protein